MQHTNTRIYRRSLELVAISRDAIDSFPVGYGYLADQLRRAASSVVLNFSEGTGKRTRRDRRRYSIPHERADRQPSFASDPQNQPRFEVGDGLLRHQTGMRRCAECDYWCSRYSAISTSDGIFIPS